MTRWLLLAVGCSGDASTSTSTSDVQATAVTPDNFPEAYGDKYCAELEDCSPSACRPSDVTRAWDTGCTFELGKAQECLDTDWTCSTGTAAFVVPPAACDEVYACL